MLFGGLAGLVAVYLAIAYAMVLFPANTDVRRVPHDTINAYVESNGVHTDVILPISSDIVDWQRYFPQSDFKAVPADAKYIAIGWGDRDFYLNTPEWKDLTISLALGALVWQHKTVLHVSYLRAQDLSDYYALQMDRAQYDTLKRYILATAEMKDERPVALANSGYGNNDLFYEARGKYSFIETCNTWLGTGLRQAGVKVSYWTPIDSLVTWHLKRIDP